MDFTVVYKDSNKKEVLAFFKNPVDADAYRAGLGFPTDITQASIDSYLEVTTTEQGPLE